MVAHVLRRINTFIGNTAIDSFHFTMFHGWARREGCDDEDHTYFLGDQLEVPLSLYLDLYRSKALIQPRMNLVVSDKWRSKLKTFSNIEFFACVIKKVRMIPYAEGDFSHWDTPGYEDTGDDPQRILLAGEDQRSEVPLPDYFELICANLERVSREFCDLQQVKVTFPSLKEEIEFAASPEILDRYPILWHDGAFMIADRLFRILRDQVNLNYFAIASVDF